MAHNKPADPSGKVSSLHQLLLLLPFGWQLALAPWINDVVVPGLPVPFPMIWQMMGVILTSIVIAIVFRIDRRKDAEANAEKDAQ